MLIADRLAVPEGTAALFWDMDGVLLDTLSMEYGLVNQLLSRHAPTTATVPREVIRTYFPYDIPDFYNMVLNQINVELSSEVVAQLVLEHRTARKHARFAVHDGIKEILEDARHHDLATAVVSNNPVADIQRMIVAAGLHNYFTVIIGNDCPKIKKKPAPDPYLEAARRVAVTTQFAAVEDSIIGAQSAKRAGCWTIGVATGATDFETLSSSSYVDRSYTSFAPCRVELSREGITRQCIVTPNKFASHLLEHIAKRLRSPINIFWTNDDWHQLGRELGYRIIQVNKPCSGPAVLKVTVDRKCELILRCDGAAEVNLTASWTDLEGFLSQPCEHFPDGKPLVSLLQGLGVGCGISFDILVIDTEDPHYAWEAIFRSISIGLARLANTRGTEGATNIALSPADREAHLRERWPGYQNGRTDSDRRQA